MSHPKDREPGAAPPIESEVLDGDLLQDLLASLNEPVLVAPLYRRFVVNAAEFIQQLPQQDAAARVETLHTLKGSAAQLGAKCLADLAARLQAQAEQSCLQVDQAMQALTSALAQFAEVVDARLRALGESLNLKTEAPK